MVRNIRIRALAVILLALCVIALFAACSFHDDPDIEHDCCGRNCSICMSLSSKRQMEACLIIILLGICALLGEQDMAVQNEGQGYVGKSKTPVSLRVKLTN